MNGSSAVLLGVSRTVYDANGRALVNVDRQALTAGDGSGYDPATPGVIPAALTFPHGSRTVYDALGRTVRSERLQNVAVSLVENPAGSGVYEAVFVSAAEVLSSTETAYDAAGRVIESASATGAITRYEYDDAGRQTAVLTLVSADAMAVDASEFEPEAAAGGLVVLSRTEYEYDDAGRQALVRDTLGRETRFEYDALGRRVRTVFADGTSTETEYDTLGRRTAETDQAGATRDFRYDDAGRLTAVLLPEVESPESTSAVSPDNPLQAITVALGDRVRPTYAYGYDTYGRLLSIKDPKTRQTGFTYDKFGRQLSRTLPATPEFPDRTEHTEYDDYGRVDRRIGFGGQVTAFTYDDLGRVTERRHYPDAQPATPPERTYTFTYDAQGRQETVSRQEGTAPAALTTYTYDTDGCLATVASPEGTIAYGYDVHGRKTSTETAGNRTEYAYDELGRLVGVRVTKRHGESLATPETTAYTYTQAGSRASQLLPSGVNTLYTYDDLNRLTELKHFSPADELLAGFTYALRADGRRQAVQEQLQAATRTVTYTYDELNRLTAEDSRFVVPPSGGPLPGQQFTATYAYDLVGNRLQKTTTANADGLAETVSYAYNPGDQLLTETSVLPDATRTTAYTYSANGERTGETQTEDGSTLRSAVYGYDPEGRLATAHIQRSDRASDGTQVPVDIQAEYAYDHTGIRVRADSTVTHQDTGQLLSDNQRSYLVDHQNLTGYAQVLEEYGGGSATLSHTVADDVLGQSVGSVASWLLYDGHGSTRALADSAGQVTATFSYDAYGVQLGGPPNAVAPAATDLLYCGEQFSPELQMLYLRARDYDQATGAFASLDTFVGSRSDPQSLHKYAYCHGDPVGGVDPTGEMTYAETMAVGIIVGALLGMLAGGCIARYYRGLRMTDGEFWAWVGGGALVGAALGAIATWALIEYGLITVSYVGATTPAVNWLADNAQRAWHVVRPDHLWDRITTLPEPNTAGNAIANYEAILPHLDRIAQGAPTSMQTLANGATIQVWEVIYMGENVVLKIWVSPTGQRIISDAWVVR